jgi:hypothetical protein
VWSILGQIQKDGPYGWWRNRAASTWGGGDWGFPLEQGSLLDEPEDFDIDDEDISEAIRGALR